MGGIATPGSPCNSLPVERNPLADALDSCRALQQMTPVTNHYSHHSPILRGEAEMTVLHPATNGTPRGALLSAPIAADLAEVEHVFTRKLSHHRGHVSRLVAHVEHYSGKRLRPTLLLLAARACGPVAPAHHVLGAVVEMIHTATLVHDDVLDDAAMRRHVRTVNATWGNQASILLGDMLFSHAFPLASEVDARACEIIGHSTNRVCEGELHQVSNRGNLI